MPGTEHNGEMYADYLVEMTTAGQVVWEWRTWEHLDPEADCITAVQDQREEWTHGNGVAELPNGDIVLSFRNISTVIIIDRKTGEIIWKLGAPPLSGQHAPMPLPNGNLLLFDNGPHRLDHTMPFSRVIEVDCQPSKSSGSTRRKEKATSSARRISNAQRLPNGNTLDLRGRFRPALRSDQLMANWSGNSSIPILAKDPPDQTIASSAPTGTAKRRSLEQRRRKSEFEFPIACSVNLHLPELRHPPMFLAGIHRGCSDWTPDKSVRG